MKKNIILLLVFVVLFQACSNNSKEELAAQWKQEIVQAEKDFSAMAGEDGIPAAFLAYAAQDAVLKRGNNLVVGKDAIKERFAQQNMENVKLEWSPDFVDVSESGDLGYTYGNYTFTSIDSLGNKVEDKGIFHTVWKRQTNGAWRFVWD
jgi:ketosteroid isomerase-like protein